MLSSQRRLKNSGPKFPTEEANVNKKLPELSNLVSKLSIICSGHVEFYSADAILVRGVKSMLRDPKVCE